MKTNYPSGQVQKQKTKPLFYIAQTCPFLSTNHMPLICICHHYICLRKGRVCLGVIRSDQFIKEIERVALMATWAVPCRGRSSFVISLLILFLSPLLLLFGSLSGINWRRKARRSEKWKDVENRGNMEKQSLASPRDGVMWRTRLRVLNRDAWKVSSPPEWRVKVIHRPRFINISPNHSSTRETQKQVCLQKA